MRGVSRSGRAPDGVEAISCDLVSQAVHPEALDGVDVVFHLAGKAHALSASWRDEEAYLPVNVKATRCLLAAAGSAHVDRFVYFSSVKAMGPEDEGLRNESWFGLPMDMYGRSKLMAEQLVLEGDFVAEPVVIRPVMVYGNTGKGNLPKMIRAIERGMFPPLPELENRRSMVHLDDIVRAAILAAEHPRAAGQTYIVTDGQAYSTRQMYEWICDALQRPIPGWSVPLAVLKALARAGDALGAIQGTRFMFDSDALESLTGSACYSAEKIQHELGFQARRNLKDALPDIVQYVQRYCL